MSERAFERVTAQIFWKAESYLARELEIAAASEKDEGTREQLLGEARRAWLRVASWENASK
jgi:hypothetical protein